MRRGSEGNNTLHTRNGNSTGRKKRDGDAYQSHESLEYYLPLLTDEPYFLSVMAGQNDKHIATLQALLYRPVSHSHSVRGQRLSLGDENRQQ